MRITQAFPTSVTAVLINILRLIKHQRMCDVRGAASGGESTVNSFLALDYLSAFVWLFLHFSCLYQQLNSLNCLSLSTTSSLKPLLHYDSLNK